MTQPDEDRPAGNETPGTARDRIRAELLISGLYDMVPLAQVESVISRDDLASTTAEQQEFALQTIRSLVADGLLRIGDLPGPGEKFPAWDLPIDAAMKRVYDLLVGHYDEPALWEFTVWLALTPPPVNS